MASGYKIPDEPLPSAWARFTCDPNVIVTAGMVGGSWLAAPWFAFNAFAVGSATQRREMILAAAMPIATSLFGMLLTLLVGHFGWPFRVVHYGALLVYVVKFALLYELQRKQAVTVGIHRYLGRSVMQGWPLVALGYFGRSFVVQYAFGVSDWLGWAVI